MEKTYYKGKILDKTKLQTFFLDLGNLKNTSYSKTSDTFLKYLNTLEENKKEDFIKKIKDIPSNNVTSLSNPQFSEIKLAINYMIDVLYNEENKKSIEIIFELITSENGDLYGKELLTGLLFPITSLDKVEYKVINRDVKNAIVSDEGDLYIIDTTDKKYYDLEDYHCANYKNEYTIYYRKKAEKFVNGYSNMTFYPINLNIYYLNPIINDFQNLDLCEAIVFNQTVANKNEIDEYISRFKGIMKTRAKRKFIENITTQYNKNIFNSEIKEKEEVQEVKKNRIEKDTITLKLENIEYLLAKLKMKNIEMYEKFLIEYNELINSEDKVLTLTPINLESLTLLEGKIEFYLEYSKKINNNILDLLNDLKNEYLDNFQNNKDEVTKLTIIEIDKLNELFLKTKKEYSIKEQMQILKDITFLYIMEIIEDDNIKISDLENSYFKDNLKYAMIVIMSLVDNDIIKDDILINLENELNINNIYHIIKNIEFKKCKQKLK